MRLVSRKGINLFREYYIDMDIRPMTPVGTVKIPTTYGGESVIWQKTIGDKIEKCEVIATLKNDIPVYSPFGGYLKGIEIGPSFGHIKGMQYAIIEISDSKTEYSPAFPDIGSVMDKEAFLKTIKSAAIIDEVCGNYLYDTILKYETYENLIIDAVDDQPYDLSRTATLINYKNEVIKGAEIIADVLKIKNKELLLMKNFRTNDIFRGKVGDMRLINVTGKYPFYQIINQYSAKTKALHIGIQCCRAVYRAVYFKEPQMSQIVTVWGDGVKKPCNVEIKTGTLISDILSYCEASGVLERVVSGGVMRGYTASISHPMFRWDTSLFAMKEKTHHKTVECINCGRCAKVCPLGLAPYYMLRSSRKHGENRAKQICADMCVQCGACSYICPARISLADAIDEYNNNLKGEA